MVSCSHSSQISRTVFSNKERIISSEKFEFISVETWRKERGQISNGINDCWKLMRLTNSCWNLWETAHRYRSSICLEYRTGSCVLIFQEKVHSPPPGSWTRKHYEQLYTFQVPSFYPPSWDRLFSEEGTNFEFSRFTRGLTRPSTKRNYFILLLFLSTSSVKNLPHSVYKNRSWNLSHASASLCTFLHIANSNSVQGGRG